MNSKRYCALSACLVSFILFIAGPSSGKQEDPEVCIALSDTQIPLGGQTRANVVVRNVGSEKIFVSEPKVTIPSLPTPCDLKVFGEGMSPMLEVAAGESLFWGRTIGFGYRFLEQSVGAHDVVVEFEVRTKTNLSVNSEPLQKVVRVLQLDVTSIPPDFRVAIIGHTDEIELCDEHRNPHPGLRVRIAEIISEQENRAFIAAGVSEKSGENLDWLSRERSCQRTLILWPFESSRGTLGLGRVLITTLPLMG